MTERRKPMEWEEWRKLIAPSPNKGASPTMRWNNYFMGLAQHVASQSKDPSTKVGAVIVDNDRRIVSTGFNGPPRGTCDAAVTDRDTKLMRTLHAEENAVLFARRSVHGYSMFTTAHPCAHCAAVIVQVGIMHVYHPPVPADFANRWYDQINQAQAMFREAGVSREVIW